MMVRPPALDAALEADRRHVWHPFTQMSAYRGHERMIERASGNYLYDADGRSIFDATSSIWLNIHGHCHPAIAAAIARQARELDHATLLGQSNVPASFLAQRLAALLSPTLTRVFYGSDGASAVEAALKIAVQYWHNRGEQRTCFVAHRRGYHGDTIGAMSVSAIEEFSRPFDALRFPVHYLPWEAGYLDALAALLRERAGEIAAVIVEPLVQLAGGVRLMSPETLAPAAALCRRHGTLLIADEIATGFGRTGTLFAFEQAGIEPDMVLLGKSLTGGCLPLSATVVAEQIFEAFLGDYGAARHFFHGHSYAGNPIACAAALANLDLFSSEHTLARVNDIAPRWHARLDRLRAHPRVGDVRRIGYLAGIDLRDGLTPHDTSPTRAWALCDALWDAGFFVRPLGTTLTLVPPLSSTEDELIGLVDAVARLLDD